MTRKRSVRAFGVIALVAMAAASLSCGSVVRESRAPVLPIIDLLVAAQGHKPAAFSGTLTSDVITNVTTPAPCSAISPCPTIFNDLGQVTMHFNPKQQPTTQNPFGATSTNELTITRYRVRYTRADGRNTPGVDVPFGFDGAVTFTIPVTGAASAGFEIVRHSAKEEAPLVQLINSPTIISTIAEVTFYGRDTVGNAFSVSGFLTINFGNFGD